MATSSMTVWGPIAPGSKLFVGFLLARVAGTYVQYNPQLVPRGVFDSPYAWYASMAVVMAVVYSFLPKTSATDQQTLGNDMVLVASVEACVFGLSLYCQWRGYELQVEPAWWRSWVVVDGAALTLSTLFIQRAEKEVSRGNRP